MCRRIYLHISGMLILTSIFSINNKYHVKILDLVPLFFIRCLRILPSFSLRRLIDSSINSTSMLITVVKQSATSAFGSPVRSMVHNAFSWQAETSRWTSSKALITKLLSLSSQLPPCSLFFINGLWNNVLWNGVNPFESFQRLKNIYLPNCRL